MPAPNIETLLDIETQVENAWRDALETKLRELEIPAEVQTTRKRDIESSPRIELSLSITNETDQRTTRGQANPRQVAASYDCTLTVRVVTTREVNDELHGPIRGITRYILSGANAVMNSTRLPYHQILMMQFSGSQPEVNAEKHEDYTTMSYALRVAINNDAWPATA